jgi:hypothetical protein
MCKRMLEKIRLQYTKDWFKLAYLQEISCASRARSHNLDHIFGTEAQKNSNSITTIGKFNISNHSFPKERALISGM